MSRSLILRLAATSFVGLLIGAFSMFQLSNEMPSRGIASIGHSPVKGFPAFSGKGLSMVQVELRAPMGVPPGESEETILEGTIRLNQDIKFPLFYRWELPDGVRLTEGSEAGELTNVKPREPVRITIRVRGFTHEQLQMIALHGFLRTDDGEFGNTALLTSRPEDSYDLVNVSSPRHGAPAHRKALAESEDSERPLLKGKILR